MSLFQRLNADIVTSQKGGQKENLAALRLVRNALLNRAKDLKLAELTDEEAITVLGKEAKKRRESITAFKQGNRQDLANQEAFELAIIEQYLPAQMTDEEIEQLISQEITAQGLSAPYDFGRLMGVAVKKVAGRADGQRVKTIVEQLIKAK